MPSVLAPGPSPQGGGGSGPVLGGTAAYVFVSEYDTEAGHVLREEWPHPTGVDPVLLSELLIPETSQRRLDDWVVFFLNQVNMVPADMFRMSRVGTTEGADLDALVYTFNNATGGWVPYGEEEEGTYMTLRFVEEGLLVLHGDDVVLTILPEGGPIRYGNPRDLFWCAIVGSNAYGFMFESVDAERLFQEQSARLNDRIDSTGRVRGRREDMLCVLGRVVAPPSANGRRVGLAIATSEPHIHVFKPLLIMAVDTYLKDGNVAVAKDIYDAVNAMDMSGYTRLSHAAKMRLRDRQPDPSKHMYQTAVKYRALPIPVRLCTVTLPDEIGDASVKKLVRKFGGDVMRIYNAVLLEWRVVFLGQNSALLEIAEAVFASVQLVCPPLTGVVCNAFPTAPLTALHFIDRGCTGYIVGATSPVVVQNEAWWDLVCNLDTGGVLVHPRRQGADAGYSALDSEFVQQVLDRIEDRYGDAGIRLLFMEYTQHIMDMALKCAHYPDDQTKKREEVTEQWGGQEANAVRMAAWLQTGSYRRYVMARREQQVQRLIQNLDVEAHINTLRMVGKPGNGGQCERLYEALVTVAVPEGASEERVNEFLSYLPERSGGLYPIAVGLLHGSRRVRECAVMLLDRVGQYQDGQEAIQSLNVFLQLAYQRQRANCGLQPLQRGPSMSGLKRVQTVVFAPGCTLDFSLLAEADETDPAQQDGTSLSFTLRGSGPTRHVHLRAPTAALRDRWVIALQLSAAAIGDDSTVAASVRLAHHIGVVRMAHEVLLSQTARLAEFAEALGQYPEILSLLGDSRIGSMLTSSTISTCTDAVQWVSDLEGQYEAAMEREAEAQQQLVELAQSLAGMGHTQLENIADGLDSEVDQSNQENGHDPVLGGHHDGSNWLQQLELYQEASRAQASLLVSRAATVRTLARSLAGAPTDPTAPPVSITVGSVSSMSRTPSIQSLPPIAARRNTSQTAMWESASAYGAAQQQRQTPTHLYPPPATSTYSQSNTPIMQASSAGTLVGAAMCSVRDSCGEMVRFLASHLVYLHAQYRRSVQRTHALQRRILAGVSKTGGGDDRPLDKNDPQRLSTLYAQATMSVSVSDVYEAFFGHSPTGLLALYAQLRYFDIQIGTWSSDGLTAQRTNKFSANIDTPLDNRARYYVADIGAGQSHVEMSGELVWVAKPYFGTVCNMIESQASGAMKEYADRFRECVLKFQLQEGLTSASDEQKHTGREAERKEGPTRRHLHRTASKNAPPPVTGGNGGSVPLFQALGGVCAVLAVGSLALALHLRRSSH